MSASSMLPPGAADLPEAIAILHGTGPLAPGFSVSHSPGRWLAWLMRITEYVAGVVLAVDVLVVFVSVIFRYF